MSKLDQYLIFIPCYNEEQRLNLKEFSRFSESNQKVHFCFVNDGSSDNTKEIIEKASMDNHFLQYISFEQNYGKANVLQKAFLEVLNSGKLNDYQFIGFWDADLSTPLNEINYFQSFLESETDTPIKAVFGARVKKLGSKIERKLSRHILGRIFANISKPLLKAGVYDTQCGAKIFSKELYEIAFLRPFVSKWFFDIEILLRLESKTSEIFECPLRSWVDVNGSKLKFLDFVFAPLELIKIFIKYKLLGPRK